MQNSTDDNVVVSVVNIILQFQGLVNTESLVITHKLY